MKRAVAIIALAALLVTSVPAASIEASNQTVLSGAAGSIHTTSSDFQNGTISGFQINGTGEAATLIGPNNQIDDFEDGATTPDNNWGPYAEFGQGIVAQTGTVLNGTYSGALSATNDLSAARTVRATPVTSDLKARMQLESISGTAGDETSFRVHSGSTSNTIAVVGFAGDGDIVWDPNGAAVAIGTWQPDTPYTVGYDWDFPNNTVDILLNGTVISTQNLLNPASSYDMVEFLHTTSPSGTTNTLYVDEIGPMGANGGGTYVSANHTVENAATATVNVTAFTGVSANATVEYYDGSTWVEAGTSNITSTGVTEIALPDVSSTTWRTTINATQTAGGGFMEIASEGIRFTARAPTVTNGQPTDTLQTSSTTLSVDVSDADFGLLQGDTVTVEFRDDGTLIGTNSTTSNGTVSVPYNDIAGGTHEITATATDSYGNTDSVSWTFSTPSTLYIRNESNTSQLVTTATEIEVTFFDGEIVTKTTTDGTVNLTGLDPDQSFIVDVEGSADYYGRTVYIESIIEQQTVYLLNNNQTIVPSVEVQFTLSDRTGNFEGREARLIVQKALNVNGTTAWVRIHSDEFGVGGVQTNLEKNVRYRLVVTNADGDMRVLGTYTARQSETVPLRVGNVVGDPVVGTDGYTYNATYDNSTGTPVVRFSYLDENESTSQISVEIYERGNESNVLFVNQTFTAGPYGNLSVAEIVPAGQRGTTWTVEATVVRNGEQIKIKRTVGPRNPALLAVPTWLKTFISIGSIWLIAGLFSRLNGHIGGLVTAGVGGLWWFIDWLPAQTGIGVVVLSLITASILFLKERATGV